MNRILLIGKSYIINKHKRSKKVRQHDNTWINTFTCQMYKHVYKSRHQEWFEFHTFVFWISVHWTYYIVLWFRHSVLNLYAFHSAKKHIAEHRQQIIFPDVTVLYGWMVIMLFANIEFIMLINRENLFCLF